MTHRLAVLAMAVGCGGKTATVTVTVADYQGAPVGGATVYTTDLDGSVHSVTANDLGVATASVEAGGTVWHNRFQSDPNEGADFTAFTNVQDGDAMMFGTNAVAQPATTATMTIAAVPPSLPSGGRVQLLSVCGQTNPQDFSKLDFDARCNGVADILALAEDKFGFAQSYAFLPAQPVVQGGTITVDAGAWHALDTVSVTLTGATLAAGDVRNDFGVSSRSTATGTVSGSLPLVGKRLSLSLGADSTTAVIDLPIAATQTVDLSAIMLPNVTSSDGAWSIDDPSKLRGTEWGVTSYRWQLPSPTGGAAVVVHVYAPAGAPGAIPDVTGTLAVPDSRYAPIDGLIEKRIGLLRFDGLDDAGILQNIDEYAVSLTARYRYPFIPCASVSFAGLP